MWYGLVFQAKGLAATLAGEVDVSAMDVCVFLVVMFVTTAKAVFARARSVVNLVQQLLFREETQRTEDAAPIHLGQHLLYIAQCEGLMLTAHLAPYEYAYGGGAYAMGLQVLFCLFALHYSTMNYEL